MECNSRRMTEIMIIGKMATVLRTKPLGVGGSRDVGKPTSMASTTQAVIRAGIILGSDGSGGQESFTH